MQLSDGLLIAVTLIGPIAAIQVQKWIERDREQRNKRLWIFQTLMATRALRASSNEHVQALNLIDIFFDGKGSKDKAVRDAWTNYFDFLQQRLMPDASRDAQIAHEEKQVDFLVLLLEALSAALGYKFGRVQLKRGAYFPQVHADDNAARLIIRDSLVKILSGQQPIPMSVVHFPVSDEAMQKQVAVQEAILKTLSGETPLKILSNEFKDFNSKLDDS